MKNESPIIGTKIEFTKCYDTKCCRRFEKVFKDNSLEQTNEWILKPKQTKYNSGYIIGIRHVIMTEFKYHAGRKAYSYYDDNYESAYVTGKKERCYLVVFNERVKPVLVRSCDAVTKLK